MSKEKKVIFVKPKLDEMGDPLPNTPDFMTRVKYVQTMLAEEYTVVPMPFLDYTTLNKNSNQLDTKNTTHDIEDLIPEAIELYKEAYKSPPIGEDIDNIIIKVISDFRESLNQGIKESSTTVERFLNESEEQYIIDILMDKGYREPSFLRNRYTEDSTIVEYTRIQMCM